MSFGTSAQNAAAVTRAVKAVTKKPIIIKLTPNVTDITEIAKAVEAEGADGVSLINTLSGMRISLTKRKPLLANVTGGLSGPCVFPVALRCVWQVYKAVNIPIVGMGGVTTAEDVIEMMMAGATAVEVGAANLVDPYASKKIVDELPSAMEKYHISALSDIIGAAHKE
jgi:dihydroorotate dehydrogenase (NAD+) catalytic subunit